MIQYEGISKAILTNLPDNLSSIQWCGAFKRFKCFFGPRAWKIIHQYNSLRIVLPLPDTLFQKLWHDWQRLNWIEDFTSNSRYKPWWRWEGKRPHPRILCDLNRPTIHLSQRRKQNGGWNEDLWKFVGKYSAFISIYLSNFMKKRLILQMRNGSSTDNHKFLILIN